MRYELGVLQMLVASSGRNRPARVDAVARALGTTPIGLDDALRTLRTQGFVDSHWQPTEVGRARARCLQGNQITPNQRRKAPLPSRIPPPSGSFEAYQPGELRTLPPDQMFTLPPGENR